MTRAIRVTALLLVLCGLSTAAFVFGQKQPAPQDHGDLVVVPVYRPGPTVALLRLSGMPTPRSMPRPQPELTDEGAVRRAVRSHASLLAHEDTLRQAINDKRVQESAWFAPFKGKPQQAARALGDGLKVAIVPDTWLIAVSVDVQPASDAALLANALCDAYIRSDKLHVASKEEEKVRLLKLQQQMADMELKEEVIKSMRQKEADLGNDQVTTFALFNGKQLEVDRLSQQRFAIMIEVDDAEVALKALQRATADGKPVEEVEAAVAADPKVARLREELLQAELDLLTATADADAGPEAKRRLERRRDALRKMLEQASELAYTGARAAVARKADARIHAALEKADLIDERMPRVTADLGKLNQAITSYQALKERDKELRDKVNRINEEIATVTNFVIASSWSNVEFARRAVAPAEAP